MSEFNENTPLDAARSALQSALIRRATENAEFRRLLVDDPHGALKSALGKDPVPSLKISVIEEKPGEVVIVLPRSFAEDELPDSLLDMVSGGNFWNDYGNDCKQAFQDVFSGSKNSGNSVMQVVSDTGKVFHAIFG